MYFDKVIRRSPIVSFYLLAFVISWLGGIALVAASHGYYKLHIAIQTALLVQFGIGPAVSAIVVKRITKANPKESSLLRSLLPTKHHWMLYAFAVLFPLALIAPMLVITKLVFPVETPALLPQSLDSAFGSLAFSCLANPWEEVGWRGFALPRIQAYFGPNGAALVIGIITGIWHLPLFWLNSGSMSSIPFLYWIFGSIATSFSLTWIYNWSKGSLFLTSILHISLNASFAISGIDSFKTYAIISAIASVIFAILNWNRLK